MFTGIIEEIGTIRRIDKGDKSIKLIIECTEILSDTNLGDSISVNGVCLTVTSIKNNGFTADVMPETLRSTNLTYLKPGDKVNLERALSPNRRFGGHIVSGHIDGIGRIINIAKEDNAIWITIDSSKEILKYIVHKGSVAIDGISLTVQYVDEKYFKVSIIPHTRDCTTLYYKNIGEILNLECDILGKYIERLMLYNQTKQNDKKMTMEYLLENGF